jgi:hypothetical protein
MTHPAAGPRIDHTTQHRHLGNKAVPPGGAIPYSGTPSTPPFQWATHRFPRTPLTHGAGGRVSRE